MAKIKTSEMYFTIHENDAGTEAYKDSYVYFLQAQIKILRSTLLMIVRSGFDLSSIPDLPDIIQRLAEESILEED